LSCYFEVQKWNGSGTCYRELGVNRWSEAEVHYEVPDVKVGGEEVTLAGWVP
jgi:hypothetical protein